jgi:hypothetical protein
MVALLCVHRVDEVPDLNCKLLAVPEMQRILLMRNDLGEVAIERIVEYLQAEADQAEAAGGAAAPSQQQPPAPPTTTPTTPTQPEQ